MPESGEISGKGASYMVYIKCDSCSGKGHIGGKACPSCNGMGKVNTTLRPAMIKPKKSRKA